MLRISELTELARGLDAQAFAKQMGPFALMQRPASEARAQQGRAAKSTVPLQASRQDQPAPVEFADLLVATLPPPLPNGQLRLVIGRSPDCELVIDDSAVSSRHAEIQWNGTAGVLVELGSSNGTFVNNQRVQGQRVLNSNDQLAFGRSHFVYHLAASLHERLKRAAASSR